MKLCREGLISGPSTGMALQGLFDFLQKEKDSGTLQKYADQSTGEISCVFVCCDLPQKHLNTYFKKLAPEEFQPIINEELLAVDQHVYSFRWEIDPRETHRQMPDMFDDIKQLVLSTGSAAGVVGDNLDNTNHLRTIRFIDLRSRVDFESCHVIGAYSSPLPNSEAESKSPFDFGDIDTLIDQCKELDAMIENPEVSEWLFTTKSSLVVLCYNGDTSRVMTTILRARGVEAYSFIDGMPGLVKYLASQRA
ncbi:hypothetical protein FQN49_007698 [Arthroderma sp. PD_2]|nr:hypothetical protein FQN49_007698 [Arthroderma sp. PD_2]